MIGIVGIGYWGPNLVRNFVDKTEVMICDVREERLREIKEKFPMVSCTTSYDDMLTKVDAVCIATPINSHFQMAKQALLAGKHTLVEKPMALQTSDAMVLVKLAQEKNLVLWPEHTFLYSGAVNKIKELLPQLGDIYYFESTRTNLGIFQRDTNVLWDLAPHDISILYYLFDKEPSYIKATGCNYVSDQIDTVYLNLTYPDMFAFIHLSWLYPIKTRQIVITGSKKMLVYDDMEAKDKIKLYNVVASHDKVSFTGKVETPEIDLTEPLATECQYFLDSIISNDKPHGDEGYWVVDLLERIQGEMDKLCLN